jgi:hypothetical protein
MINQRQHLPLTQTHAVARSSVRRGQLAIGEAVLGVLLLPLNIVIAIVAMVYWIVAALIRGEDEG